MKVFQFYPMANIPIATFIAAKKDLLYFGVIFFLAMFGFSMSCFIIFCPNMEAFQSPIMSFFSLLLMYTNHFEIFLDMRDIDPNYASVFFWVSMIIYHFGLTTILLGLVIGHFETEYRKLKDLGLGDDQLGMISVILNIVRKYY